MKKATNTTINSARTSKNGQAPNELKQVRESILVKSFVRPNSASSDAGKRQQEQTLSRKDQRLPIPPDKSQLVNDDACDDTTPDDEVAEQNSMPLKLFDGKKQSLDELSAESMTYIWMRRMKEIFLHMNNSKNENDEIDPFVEFDMKLAKADIDKTCDRYIENERITVMNQVKLFSNTKH
jgi:hypothetical protein